MESTANTLGATTRVDAVGQEQAAIEAVERLKPRYQALIPEELIQVNLDVPAAIVTVLGALPAIRNLRPSVVEQLPKHDIGLFDSLEDAALALNELHVQFLIATRPTDDLEQLLSEATQLRDLLLSDVTALTKRGLIEGNHLDELKGPIGYKNLAVDLNILYVALRSSWAKIQGKSAVTEAELDRAGKLQQRMMRVVGFRELGASAMATSNDLRQRAFTYFMRAYDDARRVVTYLRWEEDDADTIAPSLYSGRGTGRRKNAEAAGSPGNPASGATTASPTQPSGAAGAGSAAGQAGAAATSPAGNAGASTSTASTSGGSGRPGDDPFMH
ncbi:MAG TPA: hypothetical protein VFQ61_17585 [Polyangiaceae bacterium]|nr:hypothetical protein [Polyangiaceae bacterium]